MDDHHHHYHQVIEIVIELPPPMGSYFTPTDEDLFYYLMMKNTNRSPVFDPILDFNVYTAEPWLLPISTRMRNGDGRHRYYYTAWKRQRSAGNGYWKASSGEKPIIRLDGMVLGHKRTLVYFYKSSDTANGNPPPKYGFKTDWIMHEYNLPSPPDHRLSSSNSEVSCWTICKIGQTGKNKLRQHL